MEMLFFSDLYIYYHVFLSGRIVCDSDNFHNKKNIWPEGYTAFRKFTSIKGILNL